MNDIGGERGPGEDVPEFEDPKLEDLAAALDQAGRSRRDEIEAALGENVSAEHEDLVRQAFARAKDAQGRGRSASDAGVPPRLAQKCQKSTTKPKLSTPTSSTSALH